MYMSANFQVISDPVVFQNAQVTIYRAQKVVDHEPADAVGRMCCRCRRHYYRSR